MTLALGILNTPIVTADGTFEVKTIDLNTAKTLVATNDLDSAIGYQSTADVMSTLLGVNVPMNRQEFYQKIGQQVLVFKLNKRLPERKIMSAAEIEEMGYSFKLMTRTA